MQDPMSLFGIISALAIGTVSPRPSFVVVACVAVSASQLNGVTASLGVGFRGAVFAAATLLGLQAVLPPVPVLFALSLLCGIFAVETELLRFATVSKRGEQR